jgi:hypothetical protein
MIMNPFRPDVIQVVVDAHDLEPADSREIQRVSHFWMLVDMQPSEGDCWPWLGYTEGGYGRYQWRGRMVGAHELALTFTTGEKRAEGFDTCHACNNPICCNPNHLRFDTRASNVADMLTARRDRPGRFTDEQIITMRTRYANGARQVDLATQYGVTNGLVSQIVRGIRYARVGGPISQTGERYNHGE